LSFGLAASDCAQSRNARHVRSAGMLGPAFALLYRKHSVGIDFVLELGEKGFAGRRG
jgi:hypothetical protein